MLITPMYAGILTLVFVVLSFRVIGMRRSQKIGLGDGNNKDMLRRIRAHGNFAEYVPLALVLMTLIELQDKSNLILHAVGSLLIVGRLVHVVGLNLGNGGARVIGMALTFTALITGAVANLGLTSLFAALLS